MSYEHMLATLVSLGVGNQWPFVVWSIFQDAILPITVLIILKYLFGYLIVVSQSKIMRR